MIATKPERRNAAKKYSSRKLSQCAVNKHYDKIRHVSKQIGQSVSLSPALTWGLPRVWQQSVCIQATLKLVKWILARLRALGQQILLIVQQALVR